jgi:hypothetical protein
MIKMNQKTLVWVAILGGGAYVAYMILFQKKIYAQAIINAGNYSASLNKLMEFDKPFLKPWANASKLGNPTFMFDGKEYITNGGRAKR